MDESGIEATQALDFGDYDDDVTDDELGDNVPVAYLNVVCQKGFPGKLFPVFEGDNVIGRGDECKISIPLKALSREHACIEVKGDSHFIYDKGSRNRTRRNKHFLAASVRYELKDKDKLIFGDVECEYQLGLQGADDDETGSESEFQTAPIDETLDNSIETEDKTEIKPPEEEDYASDASSDILEPTQPSIGNTELLIGHRTLNGNSTLSQNITVKETPAAPKTKRLTEDIVLPESGSDTDEEGSTKPPATLAIAADSQDDENDEFVKSRMMGAATQAYICESDVTTDDENDIANRRSLLAAPTQAFVDDDFDISTCSEDTPKKKMLFPAATQAFAADSDDEKSSAKKKGNIEQTVAYEMVVEIEPTQGYDMDVDSEERDETGEEKKSSGILLEQTQAYLGNEPAEDKDDDDAKSDTSEDFVLEGDTDAEDNEDVEEMLAAPTLACDADGVEEGETQVVSTEVPTQVKDGKTEDDATVAVGDEPTQVFDEPKSQGDGKKTGSKYNETVLITEIETQVFEGKDETSKKSCAVSDDATQVFDENDECDKDSGKQAESHAAETQIFDEDATQVFDHEHNTKPVPKGKRQSDQAVETQVFDGNAAQCFEDKNDEKVKGAEVVETQVFDNVTHVVDDKTDKTGDLSGQYEMATQVFDNNDDGAVNDEGKTFDVTATSTLAIHEDVDQESETGVGGEDATQVFEEAVVGDDQTVPVESLTDKKKSTDQGKQKHVTETVTDGNALQVTEGKLKGRKKQVGKKDESSAVSETATQVFDETVAITEDQTVAINEDQTVAIVEDATQVFESKPVQTKPTKGGRKQKIKAEETVAVSDDATQVFDEADSVNQTIAVTEDQTNEAASQCKKNIEKPVETKASRGSRRQARKNNDTVLVSEDATQVFDETIAVREDHTVVVNEDCPDMVKAKPSQDKTSGKRKLEDEVDDIVAVSEDATQVFDEEEQTEVAAVTAERTILSSHVENKGKRTRGNKKVKNKNVTENVSEKGIVIKKSDSASVEVGDTVAVFEDATADESDSTIARKSNRPRGKTSIPEKDNKMAETLSNESKRKRGKGDKMEEIEGAKLQKRGKKSGTANKKTEEVEAAPSDEASTDKYSEAKDETATQRYGDLGDEAATQRYGDLGDEAATQRYGDLGDEAATQRYGDLGDEAATHGVEDDDLTPELKEIIDEKLDVVPAVAETSRGRSPLRSALASPKKNKSPSPKKVQFISQDSETGSESGEPSRRSKRGVRSRLKEPETEKVGITKTNTETQNKRGSRQKQSKDIPETESEHNDKDVKKSQVKIDILESAVESEIKKNKVNKRQTSGKKMKTESSFHNDKSKAEVEVKSNRRGRKSLDTEISDKSESTRRKTRVSLPAVLEENEADTNNKLGQKKSSKSAVEEKGNIRKNIRGKDSIQEEIEHNDKEEITDNILRKTGKHAEIITKNERKGISDDILHTGRKAKQVSETKVSGDTTQCVKKTGRQTRATLEANKVENPKETRSDTTNDNLGTVVDSNVTRSRRNNRRNTNETEKSKGDHIQNKELDNVRSDGDKREPSPRTSTRTRLSKNETEDSQSSEVKSESTNKTTQQTDIKSSAKGKSGKGLKGGGSKVKSETNETSRTNEIKSDITVEKTEQRNDKRSEGKTGKAGKGKGSKVESETPTEKEETEETDEEVSNGSKRSTRSKKGQVKKLVIKEEKQEEASVEHNLLARSRRLKRKESASSSNDSQESEKGETQAKRQKQKANSSASTPKNASKQMSTLSTPRVASNKQIDTSITNSPTLRKTTTEGGKAKVMFTGVIDEQGEKVVKELGGELVSSVSECTHLVTDQVRRTVKFLCCLSRGVPIVSPQWLVSSKTSAFFVDPTPFLVRDDASERKYKFRLDHSIDKASKEQVFYGFTFHVTKSVKPEPKHMSDILKCAGAKCVNKMPSSSSHGQTVVISCPDDQTQCEPAYKAGIPVMTAEFILTGILRQEVDWQSFRLVKEETGNKRPVATSTQEATKKRKR